MKVVNNYSPQARLLFTDIYRVSIHCANFVQGELLRRRVKSALENTEYSAKMSIHVYCDEKYVAVT